MKPRAKPAPKLFYANVGRDGKILGIYDSEQEAKDDQWGPDFKGVRVKRYQLVTGKRSK